MRVKGAAFPKCVTESTSKTAAMGYARVSTYGQMLDTLLELLWADGCVPIYREEASRAQADRRELQRMLKAIGPGAVATVARIDRLARSTFDLFAIVKQITDGGAQFPFMNQPWADTATGTSRLMTAVLGGLAEVERDLFRTDATDGRSRARACGQHMSPPPALTPLPVAEIRPRRASGAMQKGLAQSYNLVLAMISRVCRQDG
jgi:DNA invertase Pin-like site-specific DNA recombinase